MLAMTRRVTMLGISRWSEKGGSYRTVQRFSHTVIPWATVFWLFFQHHLLQGEELLALLAELKKGIIDRILEMTDEELGCKFLRGELGELD